MKKFIIKDFLENIRDDEVTVSVDPHGNLSDILESFERFLRACGYYFDGHLEIVDIDDFDEELNGEEEDEL